MTMIHLNFRFRARLFFLLPALAWLLPAKLNGQNAPLDLTFGDSGIVKIAQKLSSNALPTVVLPDGNIVAALNIDDRVYLSRYSPKGVVDLSFGAQGLRMLATPNVVSVVDMKLTPDGKLLLTGNGSLNTLGNLSKYALLRFHPDGSTDSSFGNSGVQETSVGIYAAQTTLDVLPNGKIMVFGQANFGSGLEFFLTRHLPNGCLDSTFSDNGITANGFGAHVGFPTKLVFQPDGKILAVGGGPCVANPGNCLAQFGIARYLPNGNLDSTFAQNGEFLPYFGHSQALLSDALVLPNGKIVASGYTFFPSPDGAALICLNADGTLDKSFGDNGLVLTALDGSAVLENLRLTPEGKICGIGTTLLRRDTSAATGDTYQSFVAQYFLNGKLDSYFLGKGVGKFPVAYSSSVLRGIEDSEGKVLFKGIFLDSVQPGVYAFLGRLADHASLADSLSGDVLEAQLFPNPIDNGQISVQYHLKTAGRVSVDLYDSFGRWVRRLLSSEMQAVGSHSVSAFVGDIQAGIYYCLLSGDGERKWLKVVKAR